MLISKTVWVTLITMRFWRYQDMPVSGRSKVRLDDLQGNIIQIGTQQFLMIS